MLQCVLIATQNVGKVREFRRLLDGIYAKFVGLEQLEPIDSPEESGSTFFENAAIKARCYAEHFGMIALADDSGLEVDALDGAPGIHSARYGGDGLSDADRTQLLLDEMADIADENRTARFKCVVVMFDPHTDTLLHSTGCVEGRIIREPLGTNGFGYDPVFVPNGEVRTTAEMNSDEKDRLSHRGRAVCAIAPALSQLLQEHAQRAADAEIRQRGYNLKR